MSDPWTDPVRPPVDATDLGDGVWVSWASAYNEPGQPLIWHWCTGERFPNPWRGYPRWAPSGVGKHRLLSRDPLHLEPSLYWPDCCGRHGFIRGGRWVPA